MSNFITPLINHSISNNLQLPENLYLDGELHRYCKEGSGKKDEWYIGCTVGKHVYCTYGSWSSGEKYTFQEKNIKYTAEQILQIEETRRRLREETLAKQKEASIAAAEYWEGCSEVQDHPYLDRKGIQAKGLRIAWRQNEWQLVVPVYDFNDNIMSLEFIACDGSKKSFSGAPKKAGWHTIGTFKGRIFVCEGYATAASVHEATEHLTVCSFGIGNLPAILPLLKEKYPGCKITICADLGSEKQLANIQEKIVYPQVTMGKDFNDMHLEKGLQEVRNRLYPRGIIPYTLSELIDLNIPDPEPLVENLFHCGALYFIYGKAGSCKSLFSMELAFALAENPRDSGYQIFLKYYIPKKRRVLYFDTELPVSLITKRIRLISERRNSFIENDYFKIVTRPQLYGLIPQFNLYDPRTREQLDDIFDDYDVIFFDNFQNCIVDNDFEGKENDASHWQQVSMWLKRWQDKGKTIFIVHHEAKAGTMRGTSRMAGDADDVIHITEPKKIPELGAAFEFRLEKARYMDQSVKKKLLAHVSSEYQKRNNIYNWNITEA